MANTHHAQDILGDLDLQLIADLTCTYPDCDGTECGIGGSDPRHLTPCFSVGWPPELGAGNRGGYSQLDGNLFLDVDAAYDWVVEHEAELRKEFE